MSEFRIEKRRAEAALTLTTGSVVWGSFFLAGSSASHVGPERVVDLLNAETGFFPFELNADSRPYTVLFNRLQLVQVRLLEDDTIEARLDPGYDVASVRQIRVLLSTGEAVEGHVRVYRPSGRDRVSDWTRAPEMFRYIETAGSTVIVNTVHIVELRETTEA